MLKKFTFWLIPLLAIILQACAVDSVTTYHQDKTTSILMNIDMKGLLGMAKNMDGDAELASSIVVATTVLSAVTLTIWIFVLRSFGFVQ